MPDPTVSEASLVLRPERFVAGGEAIARHPDGRVVFVRGGVPGDTVEVTFDDGHQPAAEGSTTRQWVRGGVSSVVVASPDRVEPPCEHRRAGCGGCDWQHVAVAAQHGAKMAIVADALRRTGRLTDAVVEAGGSVPAEGYRTTVRVVGDESGRAAFRRERSSRTEPAAGCLVAAPPLQKLLESIRIQPGVEVTLRVSLATGAATARWEGDHELVSGLPEYVATGGSAAIDEVIDVGGGATGIDAIDAIDGLDAVVVAGRVSLRVSADSFFQSGPAAAGLLVRTVSALAPELLHATHVLDAYAGVGLFAACCVARSTPVTTIETSASAVADARRNLTGRPATVLAGEVGAWRPDRRHAPIDVVIADPARTGLAKPGVRAVTASAAPVLVLVSCDPASLGRDAALLAAAGYRHERSVVLDLFPHTSHVETVTRFVR